MTDDLNHASPDAATLTPLPRGPILRNRAPGSVGLTATQHVRLVDAPDGFEIECGRRLGPIDVAYETYGRLNADRSNVILVLHALSGDAHAAGISTDESTISAVDTGIGAIDRGIADRKSLGWWDNMIGPGKAFDTDRYFVVSSNILGGCRGTTGPASLDPATGRPYGRDFPVVTVADMVRLQDLLLQHLGIRQILAVTGGSLGGMQALEWAVRFPDRVHGCIPIASTARLSALGVGLNEIGRRAILADPKYNGGHYYDGPPPADGLAIARMIGHVSYLSDESMKRKFGRRFRATDRPSFGFDLEFEVETYLDHQGYSFTRRFDANTYLYVTRAIDYFDLVRDHGSLVDSFRDVQARFLLISFSSDWLYP
ncbi:MAG: homoserine O-acetyltransferase, partial [Chloroflexi bacterium]|nr:homoserine O-acetyltransferase [Chloroflexota bacterium]